MSEVDTTKPQTPLETAFLGAVGADTENVWFSTVQKLRTPLSFKLDTRAEVTAISKSVFKTLPQVELRPTNRALYGPNRKCLSVLGQFEGILLHSDQTSLQTVYVVKGLGNNFLELPTIQALHLVSRVDETISHSEVKKTFPHLFIGLGNLGDPYRIQLHPDSKPFPLYTPRRVPSHYEQKS